jgi:glycerol-3-phosphate dehydrogenase subunit B
MPDLVVVGAGLTGLFAAHLAAVRGAHVTLVSLGRGGLSLSLGCLDALIPGSSFPEGDPTPDPLNLAGLGALQAALDHLQAILDEAGLDYAGRLGAHVETLTPLGRRRPTQFAPESMVLPPQLPDGRAAVAGIQGFRDFAPALVVRGWQGPGVPPECLDDLPWPGDPPRRDLYASDLARQLENHDLSTSLCELWRPRLKGIECLGVPAVLGLSQHRRLKAEIEASLGITLFEIPTLPPSVPGLRLENALRHAALAAGVSFIEGARAIGRIEGHGANRRATGVLAETAGGRRTLLADRTLLATGGILHGGLQTDHAGKVSEAVFRVPVVTHASRGSWVGTGIGGEHAYPSFGILVNERMQPLGDTGQIFAADLYAAGGLLAGPDRVRRGCRQGVDLATAHRAVEVMLT